MRNPFTRKPKPYEATRRQILDAMDQTVTTSDEYRELMHRLNEIDKILNRTSEKFKTVVPALGATGAIAGIYALQQFGGVIVPKALDALAARNEQKKSKDSDEF